MIVFVFLPSASQQILQMWRSFVSWHFFPSLHKHPSVAAGYVLGRFINTTLLILSQARKIIQEADSIHLYQKPRLYPKFSGVFVMYCVKRRLFLVGNSCYQQSGVVQLHNTANSFQWICSKFEKLEQICLTEDAALLCFHVKSETFHDFSKPVSSHCCWKEPYTPLRWPQVI